MKVVNIGNIAEAYICDDLPAMGIVIEATLDELERLPNLTYKEVTISATPRRNCDVGTAQEQDERFHRFCKCHRTGSCAGCHNPVKDYTVANGVRECALVWAQMPYEEGGAK